MKFHERADKVCRELKAEQIFSWARSCRPRKVQNRVFFHLRSQNCSFRALGSLEYMFETFTGAFLPVFVRFANKTDTADIYSKWKKNNPYLQPNFLPLSGLYVRH